MNKPQLKLSFNLEHFTYQLKNCYLKKDTVTPGESDDYEKYLLSPEAPTSAPQKLSGKKISIRVHPELLSHGKNENFLSMDMNFPFECEADVDFIPDEPSKIKFRSKGFFKPKIFNKSKMITFYSADSNNPIEIPNKIVEFRVPYYLLSDNKSPSLFGSFINELLLKLRIRKLREEKIKPVLIWEDDIDVHK